MLPATFVVNNDGREACFCPLPEDADGLDVLFFNQGTSHGSKKIGTDAAQLGEIVMLPVLFSSENMSDAVLTTQMLRRMQAHNAVVVAVECSKEVRNALCRAWPEDLDSLGGEVPSGSPNSSRVGIIRSNGLLQLPPVPDSDLSDSDASQLADSHGAYEMKRWTGWAAALHSLLRNRGT